jgi:DNA-binding beta-propeller fold protein YncE
MTVELQRALVADIRVPGKPFGVTATPDGQWLLVSVNGPPEHGVAALRLQGSNTQVCRFVPLAHRSLGIALARGGEVLAVSDPAGGVSFLDVARVLADAPGAVLAHVATGIGMGSIEVAFSADDQYVFVSEEKQGTVSVVSVHRAMASGQASSALIGHVPVDLMPVGMALSPDGQTLYVTCEATEAEPGASTAGHASEFLGRPVSPEGTLVCVDTRQALDDPTQAVRHRVPAGQNPVRVVLSHGGRIAWVTVRASNALLSFDIATDRRSGPLTCHSVTPVGAAPVGVALASQERIVLVANSNRFSEEETSETVSVLDTEAALAGREALLGLVRVGAFPREFGTAPRGDMLFLTNFASGTVSLLDVARLMHL